MSSTTPKFDAYCGFELPSELKEEARRAAQEDERSLSAHLRVLLRRHLKARRQLSNKAADLESA